MNRKIIIVSLVLAFVLALSAAALGDGFVKSFDKNPEMYSNRIGASANLSPRSTPEGAAAYDVDLDEDAYARMPLALDEPTEPVTIEAGSEWKALPGHTVDIAYTIKDNTCGFTSFDLSLPFNSFYAPMEVAPSGLLAGGTLNYSLSGDTLNVTFAAAANIIGDGELFTVTYKVDEAAPYEYYSALDVTVNSLKFDKLVDVAAIIKKGALKTYTYHIYLKPRQDTVFIGDTLYVDLMLAGGVNYTQVMANLSYDPALLRYTGYEQLSGVLAACASAGNGSINLRSVPTTNTILGASCSPDIKIVTLKFKALDNFSGRSIETGVGFNTATVNPPANYVGANLYIGKTAPITIVIPGGYTIHFNELDAWGDMILVPDVTVSYYSNGSWHYVSGIFNDGVAEFVILDADIPKDGNGIIYRVTKGGMNGHSYTFPQMEYKPAGDTLYVPLNIITVRVSGTSTGETYLTDNGYLVYDHVTISNGSGTRLIAEFVVFDNANTFEAWFSKDSRVTYTSQNALAGATVIFN
jgi:hypothetical protein